jgi:hypothetical protein
MFFGPTLPTSFEEKDAILIHRQNVKVKKADGKIC